MSRQVTCPACGAAATGSGSIFCMCDKDFCTGQRCGSNDLFRSYECACGSSGTPPETEQYYAVHGPKD
jgi:hypothetical protein